ncbi:hypothetical protein [Pseudodesulfovibrio tunisiensis]|uniref:hypothetical protein n=1 Tax=Pseudodesulfovibrio tunisiensis TaxID=463192 RepID=UPI001FB442D1|nr:hypothetical protein [Pseudodesulfovibrio tunisiensis]
MIAKFETEHGWSFMECVKLDTQNERVNPAMADEECSYSFGMDDTAKDCKRLILARYDGDVVAVYYDRKAYLMNDQGDTVCAL